MHYDTISTILDNARRRLEYLSTPPHALSVAAGKPGRWLYTVLAPGRYARRMGSDVLDELARVLGMPPWELVRPGCQVEQWPPPKKNRHGA